MKIVIVVHYFSPHVGGMEEVAKKQARSLVDAGHHVTIVTCRPDRKSSLHEYREGYEIIRLRALNFIEEKFGVTFPIISPLALMPMLRAIKSADLVHVHDVFYMTSHMAAFAAFLCNKPVYLTQHVAMVEHPNKFVMFVQHLVYGTFGVMLFDMAVRIICYNVNVQRFLLSKNVAEPKILLHYNGIDINYFHPVDADKKIELRKKYGFDSKKPIVLFVGRLVPKKGFDIVVDTRSFEYQTIIVGTGEIPGHMQDAKNVTFFGPATQVQTRDLYQLSDVFVFPAIGEILTLVMQEAMACGLPIITTDDPAYATYGIDERRVKFVARNKKAIAEAVSEVLTDDRLRQRMSAYSRQIAESRFSWDINFNEELAVYPKEIIA
jgi:glycosyltransferase involved in cell wall biosynthesis